MPDSSSNETIARQWEMLKLIPARSLGRSAGELTIELEIAGFKVSKRTVERDLQKLSLLFPLAESADGQQQRWSWIAGVHLDLPSLALSDALSLSLLEQFLRPLLPSGTLRAMEPRFRLAAEKLRGLAGGNAVSRWKDKVRVTAPTLSLLPPKIDGGILEGVQQALLADEQIEVVYRGADAERNSNLRLHPLGMVQSGARTYLVAGVFDYPDPRLFALQRFRKVERLAQPVRIPAGFSLDAYIAAHALEFGSGKTISLRAEVSESLARVLAETPLAADMTTTMQRGKRIITATVADTWQLQWWILSQADGIKILQPPALRRQIFRQLQDAVAQYTRRQ